MKKKLKKIISILILLVTILFLGYFYPISRKNSEKKVIDKNIVTKTKLFAGKFYNGNDVMKIITKHQDCNLTSSCIEIVNAKTGWYGTTDEKYPITLNNYNLLKITFKNNNGGAGISLISKYAKSTDPWWKGKNSLNLSVNSRSFSLTLDTGQSEEPLFLFTQDLNTDESGQLSVLVLFDNKGKTFSFFDNNGIFNKKIDINQESKNLFPDGLFKDGSLFFGVFIAPISQLTVSEFYLIPLEQTL
ncbi:hypothetical protein A3D78_01420 [Candidatus Gottesmanbacteria bacterium RIFCSPHIGHO2_02_FULL_39_14]|uniref:Uncharacterized protein n=1 Tax=Candidatus Gottesmanbacteria bacterium RIFCSPHIGHO2_02_FULL_39_14 TaxID=1798383 RepID=A0A1F5ZW66_9BACT|nr:MAG: hypothetical protein A3D78_01420 [Candidatus Gottesmanbacteria bacterium RIFCSPHIGHO2_02_FULL_39_14]